MSRPSKPGLSASQANELIADVQASDRQAARQAVSGGVQKAQEQWIEAPLIAEALVLELVALVRNNNSSTATAAYLRNLAQTIEGQTDFH